MPATFPPPPDVLEVVYRVERVATGVVDTEHRLVRAPFEVRIETHRAEPDAVDPDADPTLLDIAVLGGVETGPVGQDRVLVVVPPTPALRGAHLGTDLTAAEQAGVLVPLGFGRELAGRACTELRTGAPIDGGLLRAPTDDDRSDVCVDDAGIVLREEVTAGGEVVERRTAVSVDADLDLDDADLDEAFAPLGYRIPEADGGLLRAPTDDDRSDVCVDDAGIVLREEVTAGGEVVERRTAVSVDADLDDADLDEAFAPLGYRIPEADGGGRVRLVTPDSRPPDVAHHELAAPPAGTELLGRFGVLTDSVPGPDAAGSVGAVISMVDVHVGGGEVVVVENGAAVAGGPVLGRGDVPVPLPFAPEATAVFLTTGVEIRAPLETGRFVRITSTLPLADTVSLAGSMRLLDGPGAVVPADDEPDVTGRFAPAR